MPSLKAVIAEGLLEEAKEIVGLMAARGMKIASLDFSQICQARFARSNLF